MNGAERSRWIRKSTHLEEYEAKWKPLGWSEEGFAAVKFIRPQFDTTDERSVPEKWNITHTLSAVQLTCTVSRRQVELSVEEAERWYTALPSSNVVALSRQIGTMIYWGITLEEVETYRSTFAIGSRLKLNAVEVYLWKRIGFHSRPSADELKDIANALAWSTVEQYFGEDTPEWVIVIRSASIPLACAVEYRNAGLTPEETSMWIKAQNAAGVGQEPLKVLDEFHELATEVHPDIIVAWTRLSLTFKSRIPVDILRNKMISACDGDEHDAMNAVGAVALFITTHGNRTPRSTYTDDDLETAVAGLKEQSRTCEVSLDSVVSAVHRWREVTETGFLAADGPSVKVKMSSALHNGSRLVTHLINLGTLWEQQDNFITPETWKQWMDVAVYSAVTRLRRTSEVDTSGVMLLFDTTLIVDSPLSFLHQEVGEYVREGMTPEIAAALVMR